MKNAEMWKRDCRQGSQQALYSNREADRRNSTNESERGRSGKTISLSKERFEKLSRKDIMLDDEIQAEIEHGWEYKNGSREEAEPPKRAGLNG